MIETETKPPPSIRPLLGSCGEKHLAGLMCRHHRTSGFKIAIVVGLAAGNRLRVCYWRANSAKWTQPIAVEEDTLTPFVEADYAKHKRTIKQAADAALATKIAPRVWS